MHIDGLQNFLIFDLPALSRDLLTRTINKFSTAEYIWILETSFVFFLVLGSFLFAYLARYGVTFHEKKEILPFIE